jgi:uncharacterized protein (DUF302 family)
MQAMTANGLIACISKFGPKETVDRLAAAVTTREISIMARIDHAAAAAAIGMELRPTEVLIFGNPRAGTPLMQAAQTVGIDLPLKALVWQDEGGTTWLAYNDPLARPASRCRCRVGSDPSRYGRCPRRGCEGGDCGIRRGW